MPPETRPVRLRTHLARAGVTSAAVRAAGASTLRFDLLMIVVLGATSGSFFADLWAHSHGRVETFFTIWHLALYSAAGSVFLVLAVTWARAVRAGAPLRAALPRLVEVSVESGHRKLAQ